MSLKLGLIGRTALITGATKGIGKAIAKNMGEAGARLILTGTNEEEIEKNNILNKNTKEIQWVKADFSTSKGIKSFINILSKKDPIDICINNAGINTIKPLEKYSFQEYQKLVNINLQAPFMIIKHLLPIMKERQYGRIVNIASIWSTITKPHRTLYTLTKSGLSGFTKSVAVESGSYNILVNAVSPGFTFTELTKNSLSNDEIDQLSNQIPLNRFADPNEIAIIVLFLASDLNTYVTGQNIIIDGGFTIV